MKQRPGLDALLVSMGNVTVFGGTGSETTQGGEEVFRDRMTQVYNFYFYSDC